MALELPKAAVCMRGGGTFCIPLFDAGFWHRFQECQIIVADESFARQ